MKKISAFILPMLLLACDKTPPQEITFKACCDAEKYGTMVFKIWDDKAILKVDNNDIPMTKTESEKFDFTYSINWDGTEPETNVKLSVTTNYNAETKELIIDDFRVDGHGYSIYYIIRMDLQGYNPPTQSEKCIAEINELVDFYNENVFMRTMYKVCDNRIDSSVCHSASYHIPIDATDAIKITSDWSPEKLSEKKDKEMYGTEPCITLENLKKYISENKSDSEIVTYREDRQCTSGGRNIYFGCDYNDRYTYYKLSLCNNGNHTLSEVWAWDDEFSYSTELVSATPTEKGTLYSEKFSYASGTHSVLYNNDATVYVKATYSNEPYVACEVTELAPYQLCARNLNKHVKYNPESETIDIQISNKTVSLSAEHALSVTPNWNYANGIKMYQDGSADYEQDACVAQRRLDYLIQIIGKELENKEQE